MYRLITLAAIASIALATPVLAQGRYGAEAAPAQEAAAPTQPATEPAAAAPAAPAH
jgi:hypothetical protein